MYSVLRTIFWILILLLALSFFGISLRAIVNSPTGQDNFAYLAHLLKELWLWATFWIRPAS